tara:strand:+ start:91 stop:489 length:399 start_codon:yes stop_codon:yes gene_type:complete
MKKKGSKKKMVYKERDNLEIASLKKMSRKKDEKEIKEQFKIIDKDNSGYIELNELNDALKKYGLKLTLENVKKLMKKYDDNPDSRIDMQEFYQLKRDIDANNFRKTKKSIKNKKVKKRKTIRKKHKKRLYRR